MTYRTKFTTKMIKDKSVWLNFIPFWMFLKTLPLTEFKRTYKLQSMDKDGSFDTQHDGVVNKIVSQIFIR